MRDAIGGATNLVIIVVFMVIVSGYMAFNVSYMKAFKVKNKIISAYEEYDGQCATGTKCATKIEEFMSDVGYDVSKMSTSDADQYINESGIAASDVTIGDKGCPLNGAFCYVEFQEKPATGTGKSADKRYHYYKIFTRVTMDIPIFNKIMAGWRYFQVSGDTKRLLMNK